MYGAVGKEKQFNFHRKRYPIQGRNDYRYISILNKQNLDGRKTTVPHYVSMLFFLNLFDRSRNGKSENRRGCLCCKVDSIFTPIEPNNSPLLHNNEQ